MTVDVWDLVARSQAGEGEAFGELYDLYIDDVYTFIHGLVGDDDRAEDLTADTFFTALRTIGRLRRDRDTPRAWLLGIARTIVKERVTGARARLAHPDTGSADPDLAEGRRLARDHDATMIRGLIRRLDGDQRRCLELRYLDGLTVSEVAERMGRSPKAVAVLQFRAVRRLRTLIDLDDPEW